MSSLLLKGCRLVITWEGNELRILKDVNIYVEDGVIKGVGDYLEYAGDYVIDCKDGIAMPGLVNAHVHTPMSIMRGFYDDAELSQWLSKMWSVEAELSDDVITMGSELSIIEMIMSGTTAFVDMYLRPEVTAKMALKYGIRAALGPTFIDNLLDPAYVENEVRNFYNEFANNDLIRPIINVHSIYSCSTDTLLRAKELMNELNLSLQIHASETRDEVYEAKARYGKLPVEYLDSLGLLSDRTQLIHLGWVSNWELNRIAETGTRVTHAPTSNMKLATAGHFPMRELMEKGVLVTIGTDGPASNNSLDMFREMKMAVLLQRHSYWDVSIKAYHALKAATLNGYRLLGINGGCVNEGCIADMVILDARSPRMQPLRLDNVVSNIVYSATGSDVKGVIVNGKLIYDKKEDYEKLIDRSLKISEKINNFIVRFI